LTKFTYNRRFIGVPLPCKHFFASALWYLSDLNGFFRSCIHVSCRKNCFTRQLVSLTISLFYCGKKLNIGGNGGVFWRLGTKLVSSFVFTVRLIMFHQSWCNLFLTLCFILISMLIQWWKQIEINLIPSPWDTLGSILERLLSTN
jgi:hypothetical protein